MNCTPKVSIKIFLENGLIRRFLIMHTIQNLMEITDCIFCFGIVGWVHFDQIRRNAKLIEK